MKSYHHFCCYFFNLFSLHLNGEINVDLAVYLKRVENLAKMINLVETIELHLVVILSGAVVYLNKPMEFDIDY